MAAENYKEYLERFDGKFGQVSSISTKENGNWSLNYDGHEIKQFLVECCEDSFEKGKTFQQKLDKMLQNTNT